MASLACVGAVALTVGLASPAAAHTNRSYHGCFGAEVIADEFARGFHAAPIFNEIVPVANGGCL